MTVIKNYPVTHWYTCDSRHKLAKRALIAVFGLLPKRNFPLKTISWPTFELAANAEWASRADTIRLQNLHSRPWIAWFLHFRPTYAVQVLVQLNLNTSVYRPGYGFFGGHFIPWVTNVFLHVLQRYRARFFPWLMTLPSPIFPLATQAGFGQNTCEASICSVVVFIVTDYRSMLSFFYYPGLPSTS